MKPELTEKGKRAWFGTKVHWKTRKRLNACLMPTAATAAKIFQLIAAQSAEDQDMARHNMIFVIALAIAFMDCDPEDIDALEHGVMAMIKTAEGAFK